MKILFKPLEKLCRRCGEDFLAGRGCDCKELRKAKEHRAIRNAKRIEGGRRVKTISVH